VSIWILGPLELLSFANTVRCGAAQPQALDLRPERYSQTHQNTTRTSTFSRKTPKMGPSLSEVLPRLPMPLQYSQIRHLSWSKGRASRPFRFSILRNYTHHCSPKIAKPDDTKTQTRKDLNLNRLNKKHSAHQKDRVAVFAVESTRPMGGKATRKRVGIVTRYALIYILIASSVLVSITLLSAERVRL
jgi:hypothetical protein